MPLYPERVFLAPDIDDFTDEVAEDVVASVVRGLARTRWWVDEGDLWNEAWLICATTDVLSAAENSGAFYRRLRERLIDALRTEGARQSKRHVSGHVTDVGDDGTVYGVIGFEKTEDGGADITGALGKVESRRSSIPVEDPEEQNRTQDPNTGRSVLLDRLDDMGRDRFLEWATGHFGRKYAKKKDIQTLLLGSSRQQTALWSKYARGKRISGGSRVIVDGVRATPADYAETLDEEWMSRYRCIGDARARIINTKATVVSADGTTLVPPTLLRQPSR